MGGEGNPVYFVNFSILRAMNRAIADSLQHHSAPDVFAGAKVTQKFTFGSNTAFAIGVFVLKTLLRLPSKEFRKEINL